MKSILDKMNSEEVAKLNRTLVQKQFKKSSERERQKRDKFPFKEKNTVLSVKNSATDMSTPTTQSIAVEGRKIRKLKVLQLKLMTNRRLTQMTKLPNLKMKSWLSYSRSYKINSNHPRR